MLTVSTCSAVPPAVAHSGVAALTLAHSTATSRQKPVLPSPYAAPTAPAETAPPPLALPRRSPSQRLALLPGAGPLAPVPAASGPVRLALVKAQQRALNCWGLDGG